MNGCPDKLWLSAFDEKLRPSLKPYCKLEKHLRLQKEDTGGWRLVLGHSIFDDQAIIDVWCDHYLTAKMTGAPHCLVWSFLVRQSGPRESVRTVIDTTKAGSRNGIERCHRQLQSRAPEEAKAVQQLTA